MEFCYSKWGNQDSQAGAHTTTEEPLTIKAIQNNIRELEEDKLVQRQQRKTTAGDWNSNIHDLSGLVAKVQALEPEFAQEKQERAVRRAQLQKPGGLTAKVKSMPK